MKDFDQIHILIVEDDSVTQYVTKLALDEQHIKCTVVDSGEKAIETLKSKQFQCVLMDIVMPGEDGMDTVRWIRDSEDEYFKKLPIFALTSYSSDEHTKEVLDAGMNGHLVKPLDVEKLRKLYLDF
ncbi:MAG TPA: hypothetical protein DGG95_16420 [Cytophagales bacterium]|jgi:two-component system, sensor histidine kinase and response regulator|nr:hypothetical protein [Cytophagales bacterium]